MSIVVWAGFLVFVVSMVFLDLGVFHRRAQAMSVRHALAWTFFWIALAVLFNGFVYLLYDNNWTSVSTTALQINGQQAATQFFTGYLLEKSLSIDNIFVIALIFSYFRIPSEQQHRLLFWGILGAVVLRGIMIAIGAALIVRFDWIVYVFAALLIASAIKLMISGDEKLDPDTNLGIQLIRLFFPVSNRMEDGKFFVLENGRRTATPFLMALVLVETSDVMFAVDSIPAVFAVTSDPFLVFTSNVFAILGLRSLYFVLEGFMDQFRYLKMSLVFILAYVGVKMILSHHYPIPNLVSLAIIGGLLSVGIGASLAANWKTEQRKRLNHQDSENESLPIANDARECSP